jgi:SAM-dependent methyltransferase
MNSMNNLNKPNAEVPYSDAFYIGQSDRSYESASSVLPLVLANVPVTSAIDVGCGVGTWSSKLLECGVNDILCIDGSYVNRDLLRVPQRCFQAWDLGEPITMDREFDLALCLEVAEHLPPSRAEGLVEDLVKLAPVVLFSAAIPGQGGTYHVNEQYLSYWAGLFSKRGYALVDLLRPAIWNDERCDWWYRQNAVLFVSKQKPIAGLLVGSGVDYIHPSLFEKKRRECEELSKPTLGGLVKSVPGSLRRSFKERSKRFFGR